MDQITSTLATAINDVFDLLGKGETPRVAITKTARMRSMLPDQVTRLCQLYNKSATINQRVLGDNLQVKLGHVQIVDPREVLKDLSQQRIDREKPVLSKTASLVEKLSAAPEPAGHQSTKVASAPAVDAKPQDDRFAGLHHGLSGVKLYEIEKQIETKIASLLGDGEQMLKYTESALSLAERVMVKSASIHRGDTSRIKQAGYYFREIEPQYKGLYDYLLDRVEGQIPYTKRASLRDTDTPSGWLDGVKGPQSITGFVKRAGQAVDMFREEVANLVGKVAALREERYLISSRKRGGEVHNRDLFYGYESRLAADEDHIRKVAGAASGFAASRLFSSPPQQPMSEVDKFRMRLTHPQHEANLSAVRARRALQQLLVDDPVISQQPEGDVIAAYNELSAYSPQAVQNEAVLRAILRQYLQNNASSFDLSQIKQLERHSSER